ncbi:NADH dehydrogenase [ubiquinone] 1 beta subcomplex subunit 4 [Pelobates cultripes]|uniref:NADH dehydrogenase [ubiquinone] 1 beta subcomplex subunit 4 n=1 Tax=Pelobates cultripes TaxID=61616 RepID=A0AAD1QWL1_PELCU|nr:NADH dehydrogenase [ubiquinone] 1 beta subcomplex subunit 4 [Pelobates cultripes]
MYPINGSFHHPFDSSGPDTLYLWRPLVAGSGIAVSRAPSGGRLGYRCISGALWWLALEDPALDRWMYARNRNIYPNFRPTPKTSLMGLLWGVGPLFFWYYVFKTDRDRREKLIQEGKIDRTFKIAY